MDKEEKITVTGVSALVVGGLSAILCLGGCLGSRGVKDEYTFTYHGRPAAIKRNDRIWCPDTYHMVIDGKDKILSGYVISDDGKMIEICDNGFTVREAEEQVVNKR